MISLSEEIVWVYAHECACLCIWKFAWYFQGWDLNTTLLRTTWIASLEGFLKMLSCAKYYAY